MDPADVTLVIQALADPGRRALLDALRARDGLSVSELGDAVPHLGRHAVLKHLGVLEAATLVTTHKVGRVRHCYLNPVPLVALAQRWLDDYAMSWGTALHTLKKYAEKEGQIMSDAPLHRHSLVIAAPPQRVWTALTEENASWYFGTTLNSTLEPGSAYTYTYPDGTVAAEGEILAVRPNELLEMTFSPVWDDAVRAERGFRLVWRIEAADGQSVVTVEHYDVDPGSETAAQVGPGSRYLISNLKTWIETGAPMPA